MDSIQDAAPAAAQTVPAGYEPREVIWPTTGERFTAFFPVRAEGAGFAE